MNRKPSVWWLHWSARCLTVLAIVAASIALSVYIIINNGYENGIMEVAAGIIIGPFYYFGFAIVFTLLAREHHFIGGLGLILQSAFWFYIIMALFIPGAMDLYLTIALLTVYSLLAIGGILNIATSALKHRPLRIRV